MKPAWVQVCCPCTKAGDADGALDLIMHLPIPPALCGTFPYAEPFNNGSVKSVKSEPIHAQTSFACMMSLGDDHF